MLKVATVLLSFISLAIAAPLQIGKGDYAGPIKGFRLNHFERVPDIQSKIPGKECYAFKGNLFRGGAPDFEVANTWIRIIAENKIALVIDLRGENGLEMTDRPEQRRLLENGIAYVNVPLSHNDFGQKSEIIVTKTFPGEVVEKKKTEAVTAVLDALALAREYLKQGKPVFVHCSSGEARTGMFVGLLRDCDDWRAEYAHYKGFPERGFDKFFDLVRAALAK